MKEVVFDWTELAAGHGFLEGPVDCGNSVVFTSINRGLLYRVPLQGGAVTQVAETGGGPNGLAINRDGVLWVAQNGGYVVPSRSKLEAVPSIQRVTPDGRVSVAMGTGLLAPNDCAFGPDGRLWFTDPHGSTIGAERRPGALWALDTKSGEAEKILDGLAHPNGLVFGPAGDELFVGETHRGRIIRRTGLDPGEQGALAGAKHGADPEVRHPRLRVAGQVVDLAPVALRSEHELGDFVGAAQEIVGDCHFGAAVDDFGCTRR